MTNIKNHEDFKITNHSCDNDVCKLLNPCLEELLPYEDVLSRVNKVETDFYYNMKHLDKMKILDMSAPLYLLDWADKHFVFQIPNKEFIYELANKIKGIGPKTILEVGAGRGIISKYLSEVLGKNIIMTDSYDWWNYKNPETKILCPNVLKRTYIEAIEEFKPDLIIASWIPYGQCWTKDFRKYPFVKGYILIGEYEGATGCDEDWDTNWEIEHLENVDKYGICKTDVGFFSKNPMFVIKHTDVTYFQRP